MSEIESAHEKAQKIQRMKDLSDRKRKKRDAIKLHGYFERPLGKKYGRLR